MNDLRERTQETILSLRKARLDNLLASKRKITTSDTDQKEKYAISLKDLKIPSDYEIDINKYYQNVILF